MKSLHTLRIISASACIFSLAAASLTLSASAQNSPMQDGSMQPGSMQPGSMQPGSMQPGAMQDGSMQPGSIQDGSMQPGPMQNGSMQPGSMQQSPMQGSSRHASLNATDRQFIAKAAQSDMTEIQTSQLALKRSQNAQVRQFAQEMIQQHTQSSENLKPIAAQKGVALPSSLGTENQALLTKLMKLSGTQFDQAYMDGQAKAHAKTKGVYQNELKQGKDADVKAFANQVLPIVTAHLRMVQNMVAGR